MAQSNQPPQSWRAWKRTLATTSNCPVVFLLALRIHRCLSNALREWRRGAHTVANHFGIGRVDRPYASPGDIVYGSQL
jgi:hypothetical protein